MTVIICTSTGIMLSAETCRIVPDSAFTEAEWDYISAFIEAEPDWDYIGNFSDSEIGRIGRENGIPVSKSEQLLHSIADALWGAGADTEWCPDTIQAIADAIQAQRPDLVASRI